MSKIHARFGGSTAERTMNCPGWRQLADTVPDKSSSSFADRGTLLHNAVERIMQDDLEPKLVIGMEYEGIVLTQELFDEKIIPAIAAVQAIFKAYGINEWVCEEKVTLSEEAWGTSDLLGTSPAWVLVLDYKFGDGIVVSPVENHQLLFYGSAAYHTEETADLFDDIKNVVFAIVQPSTYSAEDYRVWETTTARLADYCGLFLSHIEEAKQPDVLTYAGEHCKFCPAMSICPQKTGAAQRALLMNPTDLSIISESLKLANELDKWIAEVRTTAYEQLENGADIKGWKLVLKRSIRTWMDSDKAAKSLARKLGGKKNVVVEKVITPTQAEKLAKLQKVKLHMDDMIMSKSGGTTMVKSTDKRIAVIGGKAIQAALASIQ